MYNGRLPAQFLDDIMHFIVLMDQATCFLRKSQYTLYIRQCRTPLDLGWRVGFHFIF